MRHTNSQQPKSRSLSAQELLWEVKRLSGTAEFNPVLFNYQSYEGDPAVLAIVATREGTSATIIDNKRDRPVLQGDQQRIVSPADMQAIAAQIERVYSEGDYVGSLVVDGPSVRPTEYDGPKEEPPGWWEEFWSRFEENLGISRLEAIEVLRDLRYYAGRWFDWIARD